ncbi:NACHT, LRR and PYD domains-containing protein 3-like isoform X2 [Mixophyes fleayi]|uniref:NACHT, LRR and PYD domains-containing protein 3-like isoform X2 n=1 Tax=Mixophyes fleayi TaxID=3061075 RepID=UPI003F4DC3E4
MEEDQEVAVTKEKFPELLHQYKDSTLRTIYEYYKDDLIYIVESDPDRFFSELTSLTTQGREHYSTIKNDLDDSVFAKMLVQDILDAGREAVIGFWKCLYGVKTVHPHPSLLAVLEEMSHTGDTLVQKILLDEYGHNLTPEVKDIQDNHKQHFLNKTQILVEHRPPRSKQEQKSFYISERFVNMIVVSTDHFRQRSQHELIETGRKHEDIMKKERLMLEHIALNKLFRWSCQKQCMPSVVMVSGVPGVGKTTLMQKFVYDWVNKKLYQRFAFVFFFKFQELNRLNKVSLETMILQKYPYLQSQLGNILQDAEKLLFIFDGLDESNHQMDFTSQQKCQNIKQIETLGVIVINLLRQSLLKGCSVLMTSRPTKLASVDTTIFQRVSEIMGFSPKEIQMYFEMFFQNKELSDKAFNYVRENGTLYTFCYIPSYCWIICTVLSMCFKAKPTIIDQLMSSLPKTVTQLFAIFVSNILSNHSQDKQSFWKLMTSIGWMAENGVMNHLMVFDKRDLRSFNVNTSSHITSSFLIESDQYSDLTFSFLHCTIQEFLAALVHYLDYSPEKLQSSLDKTKSYTDGRADMFLRFLCGFLASSARSLLKCLGDFSIKALKDVTSWLQKSLVDIQKDGNINIGKCLNIFECLFESQNRTLVEECLGSNRSFTLSSVTLTPMDCTALAFVLKSCRQTEALDLQNCHIWREGWESLVPILHTIKKIRLSSNKLTDISCSHLAPVIKKNKSMRKLDLSGNNLGGLHFYDLVTALSSPKCQIEKLLLGNTCLTESSCSQLASVLHNTRLRKLDLCYNNLAGPHLSDLATALSRPTCRIEKLLLTYTHLTDSSCSQLASAIKNNQSLRKLDLSNNNLAGPRFIDLVTAVSSPTCQIEKLLLKNTRMTDEETPLLVSLSNNTNLTELDLSVNHFHEYGYIEELKYTSDSLNKIRLINRLWLEKQEPDLLEMEDQV